MTPIVCVGESLEVRQAGEHVAHVVEQVRGSLVGVDGVASVRQGKVFDIEMSDTDKAKAEAALKAAADKLLANTVIENYRVELL